MSDMAAAEHMYPLYPLPLRALRVVGEVLEAGSKTHADNNTLAVSKPTFWAEGISGCINHAYDHLGCMEEHPDEADREDHLAHAATRLLLALEIREALKQGIPLW